MEVENLIEARKMAQEKSAEYHCTITVFVMSRINNRYKTHRAIATMQKDAPKREVIRGLLYVRDQVWHCGKQI